MLVQLFYFFYKEEMFKFFSIFVQRCKQEQKQAQSIQVIKYNLGVVMILALQGRTKMGKK